MIEPDHTCPRCEERQAPEPGDLCLECEQETEQNWDDYRFQDWEECL